MPTRSCVVQGLATCLLNIRLDTFSRSILLLPGRWAWQYQPICSDRLFFATFPNVRFPPIADTRAHPVNSPHATADTP